MEFYRFGRKEKDFDQGIEMVLARVLASPQFIYRIEEEPVDGSRRVRRIASATSISRRGCRSSCGARRRTRSCCSVAAQGRLKDPVGARAAGPPHAEAPEGRSAGGELRRTVAEPARSRRDGAAAAALSRLRRSASSGDAARSRAAVRHDRARGSQRPRAADRGLHVRQRAAREALRHQEHLRQPVPARDARPGHGSAAGPARQGRVPGHDVEAGTHVAGHARQVGDDEPARHAAAVAAGRRAAAAAARRGSEREGTDDAAEDAGPPRPSGLRAVPSADGSDRLRARELRRHRPVAQRPTKARRSIRRRRCSTTRRSTVRWSCATG